MVNSFQILFPFFPLYYCMNTVVVETKGLHQLTLNPMIAAPFDAFEILCIWKYHGKLSIFSIGANAPFSIIFSKVNNFLEIFQCCLKIENDVMI